jgi:hypothetical protein
MKRIEPSHIIAVDADTRVTHFTDDGWVSLVNDEYVWNFRCGRGSAPPRVKRLVDRATKLAAKRCLAAASTPSDDWPRPNWQP